MWAWAAAIGGLLVLAQLVPPGSAAAQSLADTINALTGGGSNTSGPKASSFIPTRPSAITRQTIFGVQAPALGRVSVQPVNITAPHAAAPVIVGVAAPAPYAPYSASSSPQVGYSNPEAPQPYQPPPTAEPTPAPSAPAPTPIGGSDSGGGGRMV